MNEIADNLESVQKVFVFIEIDLQAIGSVEDYQGVLDSMKDLDDTLQVINIMISLILQEMDMTLETGLADDDELGDYMNELDEEFLKQNGFSKEEIEDGVGEITKAYDSEGIYNNIL